MTLVLISGWGTSAQAHELNPSIVDVSVAEGEARMVLRTPLEVLLSGIDVDGLADTDEAAGSDRYDALRELSPDALEAEFRRFEAALLDGLVLSAGGEALPLEVESVTIPETGNTELARSSEIVLSGPAEAGALSVGWGEGWGFLIVRQVGTDEGVEPFTETISGGETTQAFAAEGGSALTGWQAFLSYISVGFDHIIPLGFDHILFVLGLFFLAPRVHALLWQVSAFTLAHTITLGLAAAGYTAGIERWTEATLGIEFIAIVEPLIALSIVYVAVENLFFSGLNRWRPLVVFGFGLLHGLGFASVLGSYGLPEGQFLPALLGFNIGVEIGQLTVIAVAFAVSIWALKASREDGMEAGVVAGYIGAGLLLVLIMPLSGGMGAFVVTYLAPFFLALAILSLLCAVCVAASSVGTAAYRQYVAIPSSLAIAAVGAFWVVERVFL